MDHVGYPTPYVYDKMYVHLYARLLAITTFRLREGVGPRLPPLQGG